MSSPEYHRKQAETADACAASLRIALEALILARSHLDAYALDEAIEHTGRAMSNALCAVRDHKDQAADAQRAANTPEAA